MENKNVNGFEEGIRKVDPYDVFTCLINRLFCIGLSTKVLLKQKQVQPMG